MIILYYCYFIFLLLPISFAYSNDSQGHLKMTKTSAFLTIASDPNVSKAQKHTVKELMNLVGESDPIKAHSKLVKLQSIVIYGGNIGGIKNINLSDISPFEDFYNLQELILAYNQITDIGPLSKLTNLKILRLDNNKIKDITPLRELKNLKELNIDNNQISDLSPLKGLINIESLTAQGNLIEDLNPIDELTKINELNLSHNQIRNVHSLGNYQLIFNLHLDHNQITNIDSLANVGKKDGWNFFKSCW